jgi:serine protease Do
LPQPNAPDTNPDENESNTNPLGSMRVSELTPELARRLDLPTGVRGVVVDAADLAELQRGDVVEEIDQQPVTSVNEFNKLIASLDPNSTHVFSMCRHRVRSFVVVRPQ